jgi:hypothetical protein
MNRGRREPYVAGAAKLGVLQFVMTFAAMSAAEWQKLVAEIRHAFTKKRIDAAAAEDWQHDRPARSKPTGVFHDRDAN